MVAPRHLLRAPITEALVDIRVKLPANTELAKLGSIHGFIVDQYPKRKERRKPEFSFEFKEGEPPRQTATDIADGYFYISSDDMQVVQVRLDGFTFSRLKPYEKWESMRDEARRLWQLYVKFASPEYITRIAVRYINHLNIPVPFVDFAEYLTAPPIVPPDLPQGVGSFLTRVVIIEPNLGASAAITQALEPQAQKDFVTIILDIDVFKQTQFALDSNEAWDLLEDFRHFKNKIFFGSVTERTLRLCE